MKRRGMSVIAVLAVVASAFASTAGAGSTTAAKTQAVSCKGTLKIGFTAPFTGGAGFLGNEQLSWAKYAVKTLAPKYGLKIKLITGDTPVEQGPAIAQTIAQKFIADKTVVAVLGPSTSGNVAASSQAFFDAGLAHISPSATRTSLTKGSPKAATPAFFRVVPGDYIQGPSDANFMIKKGAKNVVLFDFQEPYSQGLSDSTQLVLKAKGVATTRLSVANTVTDFSSFVTKVPSGADFVFFPTQKPGDAQNIAQQLLEQGKKAKVFGGDGSNDSSQFKVPGSFVSNFAPDISGIAYNKAVIAGWKKDNPGKALGSFGPPAYLATQVALNAIKKACDLGKGQIKNRRDVVRNVKKIIVKDSILGGRFRFSTKSNDPLNAQFYIFEIQKDGTYKLVS
ncbi:branched-chain amino acid ABC transporter substrate-binding protein [Gaiella sp.]|uniref:branched-chain amino acid ABC transporter substrate-binding protein n=1 Tax=Gaiella sp. TaxID=2663207 RepID=UPI003267CAE6